MLEQLWMLRGNTQLIACGLLFALSLYRGAAPERWLSGALLAMPLLDLVYHAMWGPPGDPLWVTHDPSKNVTKLKGVAVYAAASASGGVGAVDRLPEGFGPNFTGGLIERIVADSTKVFADSAAAAGVPINYVVRPEGSHT